jgi:Glycosyltransferase family 87
MADDCLCNVEFYDLANSMTSCRQETISIYFSTFVQKLSILTKSIENPSILKQAIKFLLLALCIAFCYISALDGGDFDFYLEAANKLYNGLNPYLPPYKKDNLGYSYSPFFIIVLIPFSHNFFITEFVWCILSCVMLYRSYRLYQTYFDEISMSPGELSKVTIILFILAYQFVSNNIGMVQITIFLMWIIFESLRLIRIDREILGGSLLGIIINIKIMPIVMLGYVFYRGYFKAFTAAIITAIALLFVPTIFWGWDYNMTLLQDWWHIINPSNAEHQVESGIGTHSMTAFLPVYLTETEGVLPNQRNIFGLDIDMAIRITQIAILILISLSLLYFRSLPFRKENDKLKTIWEISYFMLLIPLVIPHQQKYGFLMAIPMVGYIVYYWIKTIEHPYSVKMWILVSIFMVSMLVFSPLHGSDIIGWHAFKWSQHYRLITIATLLMIPISLLLNPERLKVKLKIN